MDVKEAGASLDSLISSFNARIAELQQFVIARYMYLTSSISDLSAIDVALKGMELQVQNIKDQLRDEAQAILKTKGQVTGECGLKSSSMAGRFINRKQAHYLLRNERMDQPLQCKSGHSRRKQTGTAWAMKVGFTSCFSY